MAQTAEFLGWLDEDARDTVLVGVQRLSYPAGTVIERRGEPASVWAVEDGYARLFVSVPDGRQTTVAYARTSEMFGWAATVPGTALADVHILVDSTLLRLDRGHLERLVETDVAVSWALTRNLSAYFEGAIRLLAVRSLGSMRERLAYDLLERACANQLRTGKLLTEATHEDLAHSIGSAREVVTRTLGDLRRAGIVATAPGVVRVTDVDRLASIVRGFMT